MPLTTNQTTTLPVVDHLAATVDMDITADTAHLTLATPLIVFEMEGDSTKNFTMVLSDMFSIVSIFKSLARSATNYLPTTYALTSSVVDTTTSTIETIVFTGTAVNLALDTISFQIDSDADLVYAADLTDLYNCLNNAQNAMRP